MSEKWMEILLQVFLYEDVSEFVRQEEYREELIRRLKANGLIERKNVTFLVNQKLEKTLMNSAGKLKSISEICRLEYSSMGNQLRLLILTDYIKKEYAKKLGKPNFLPDSLGVLPIFELLRRENPDWKLGVLCGSLIYVPDTALAALKRISCSLGIEKLPSKALLNENGECLESSCKVSVFAENGIDYKVFLSGGTTREKELFAQCMEEFLAAVDNQRYLLYAPNSLGHITKYYCVPSAFSRTKQDALFFQKIMSSHLGKYELVYTRTPQGRAVLLKGRAEAFGSRNERILKRKKEIKGALE